MFLTPRQYEWQKFVASFAEREVNPVAKAFEELSQFPLDLMKRMGKLKILGTPFSEDVGGAGRDTVSYALAVEEISKVWGSLGLSLAAHISLGTNPIYFAGSPEQRKKYLPKLTCGEWLGSYGLTEPQAGSDSGATQTTAVKKGNEYILKGTKVFITTASHADTFIITAMTDKTKGKQGISAFILDKNSPGFTVGEKEDKMGLRASDTATLIFDECRVPEENLLGQVGEGFKIFMKTLDGGRISIGAMALGMAQGVLEELVNWLKEKEFDREFMREGQIKCAAMADLATQIHAARQLIWLAASKKDRGEKYTKDSAMAKYYASEVCTRVCSAAIDIMGLEAATKRCHVEQVYRDTKLCQIGEGTSEIQRIVIAREIFQEMEKLIPVC